MKITSKNGFNGIDESDRLQAFPKSALQMMNFRVESDGSITKRRNKKTVCSIEEGTIDSIWSGRIANEEIVVFASKGRIYRINTGDIPAVPTLIGEIGEGLKCLMFDFNGKLYIKCGNYYGKYDGETLTEVEGYIPCVAMSCEPMGGGVILEQINILTDKRRQLFSGTETGVYYRLAEKEIDEVISIKVEGVDYSDEYAVDAARGAVSFKMPPGEGLNNVEIVYRKAIPESDRRRFSECSRAMLFGGNSDGRAFFWGNPEYPNYRFHTELADGVPSVEYFPINAFTVIGNSRINCIVQQYDRQLIFTENEAFYSYCELKTDALGNTYSSFPVFSLNGSKGCLIETNGCIIDNRPITLCNDGLNMWESTTLENEKNAICFSQPIKDALLAVMNSKEDVYMFDFQAQREFFFISRDTAYIFNYGTGVWYEYDGFKGNMFSTIGKLLYFCDGNVVYAYGSSVGEHNNECFWASSYINNGSNEGYCDVFKIDADIRITGSVAITLAISTDSENEVKSASFVFSDVSDRHTRISLRPAVRRCMPYRIHLTVTGEGECTVYGLTVTTREKERSNRNEIF